MIRNPFKLLADLQEKPPLIPAAIIKGKMSDEDKKLIRQIGVTASQIKSDLQADTQINYDRARLYHEIDRASEHWLVGCLKGDTKIRLCNGENVSISKMANNSKRYIGKYTWSVNSLTLNMEPDKIEAVMLTRKNTKLVRVYLDNGESIDCTPDHRFMLRNGLYKEAQYLEPNDSLMPFYSSFSSKGPLKSYEVIYNPKTNRRHYAHRLAVEDRWVNYPKRRGYVVHHKWDKEKGIFNHLNNDPSMLEIWESGKHHSFHATICRKKHKSDCICCVCRVKRGEYVAGWKKGSIPWNKDKKGVQIPWNKNLTKESDLRLEVLSKRISKTLTGCKQTRKTIEKRRKTMVGHLTSQTTRRKIAKTIKKQWDTQDQSLRLKKLHQIHSYQKGVPIHLRVEAREAEEAMLNHKVVRVEWLREKADTYDLTTEKNHNFSLGVGIIVHNSAIELYADYCTCFSSLHNASVWITSEAPKYQKELTKMLDRIGIEEKIFDWAWTTGAYGDLFVKINGIPELGVISVNDGDHPLNVSRVDHEGVLIGFYQTPQGQFGGGDKELQPPWEFSHFRLLGAKKKRPMYGDPMYAEFRTMHLLIGTSTRQVTTRYGTSLILNGLPVYKRLRLAEDSLLLARLTRGIIRYIWKLKVDSTNMEAVGELVDQYASLIKRARSLDTSEGSPYYDSKSNVMGVMEDLFIPVWGDVGDLTYDKIGGEADIKWIVDIEELRNQLACSLRTPLSLLGGFVEEASGTLGSDSIDKLDIRFARSSRRLQRALKQGIKRICQVHLAYMNMDPDPNLFEVEMSETSTAEEAELKEALDSGVEVVQKIYDLVSEIPGVNQTKVLNYLNQKVLKLEDFDLENFMDSKGMLPESKKLLEKQPLRTPIYNLDISSYLPLTESKDEVWKSKNAEIWKKKYGSVLVKEAKFSEFQPNVRQGKFKF